MSAPARGDASPWGWDSAYPAPAKLNLFLHVVGRRSDGYHLLQTVFRLLDRADVLRFAPRQDGCIVLDTPLPGVAPEQDLTVRAARLLMEAAGPGRCPGAHIRLEKHLPLGGGLGGGSSDGATVLLALNHLWGLGFSRARLQALGLTLGADVPFFIYGRSAFAQGVGEDFTPVAVADPWYLVLEPPVAVPTATIFTDPDLVRNTPSVRPGDWREGWGHNDLEAVACRHFPAVAEHLAWLGSWGAAAMSGSGACVFVPLTSREQGEQALAQLPGGWRGWLSRGLAQHPLYALASD